MYERSPIKRIENVKTPTLMILGEKDRRVPKSEGLSWVKYLQSRNSAIKCLLFPDDDHSLDEVETELNVLKAIAQWFLEHSKINA